MRRSQWRLESGQGGFRGYLSWIKTRWTARSWQTGHERASLVQNEIHVDLSGGWSLPWHSIRFESYSEWVHAQQGMSLNRLSPS